MPSLALVCIQAIVLMTVCRPFPSSISGQFISTTGTISIIGDGGDTTNFGTFLFCTTSSGVLVAFGD